MQNHERYIGSIEEAINTIIALKKGELVISEETKFRFDRDVFSVKIYVDGDQYEDCSMPSDFAKGLVEYQAFLYKAAAAVLYGVDDARKLTKEDMEQLELVYAIRDGSLDLQALAEKFIERISDGFNTMTGTQKLIAILGCAVILTTGAATYYIYASENEAEVKISANSVELEKIGKEVKLEKEQTEQFRILADALKDANETKNFERNVVEGNRAIIKGAASASKLRVGDAELDSGKIQEINSRGARTKSDSVVVTDEYVIVKIEPRDGTVTKFWLSEPTTGAEFPVLMDDSEFSEDELREIWNAARARKRIRLEINLVKNRGVIKTATLVSVPV
ncbi:hypothetical protein [Vogesella indigofera]|uniref:hypothetical protein n=1 Tax=Vogesella indigofera TaxID=45465 RepID=UPI00234EA309|nr:hypothetical protein [Vogesella indigofera]MDC7707727.1 hypothetical protein [Vogesella indigofera]